MSTDHLRWHLLREVNQIALEKIRHQDDLYWYLHCQNYKLSNNPALPKLNYLCSLFLSGKEPAAAVDFVLSQGLFISAKYFKLFGELCHEKFDVCVSPVHLRNLALRLTRFLEIQGYTDGSNSAESSTVTEIPSFVQTLRDGNCVEKFLTNEDPALGVAVVEACPYLSTLICLPEVLDSLLENAKSSFPELRAIDTFFTNFDWSRILKKLTKRPELLPTLETLTASVNRFYFEALSKSAHMYRLPTIKSYNILTLNLNPDYCAPIDFPLIASTWSMFPNLETASVTVDDICGHPDPKKLPEIYNSFEKFNPKVKFRFNYFLKHDTYYSKTQVDELETQLRTLGTITSVSRGNGQNTYSATTSYPNKTLMLKLTIELYSDDDESERSEAENAEENNEF